MSGLAAPGAVELEQFGLDKVQEQGGSRSEGIKQAALRVLRATTPGWKDSDNSPEQQQLLADGFTIRSLTGGFTNAVFRCSKPGGDNSTVLLRSYGKGTEMFFSRKAELRVSKVLGEKGFGPATLAAFEDGRVEEFLPGRALGAEDLRNPEISVLIAKKMAELHGLDLDGEIREPLIYRSLEIFYRNTLKLCGESHGGIDIVELGQLITGLRERLEKERPSKIVFGHNDLQCGNIMYSKPPAADASASASAGAAPEARLSLIDYEFAGYNPRGFDIGTHFGEWSSDYESEENPDVLYPERYPSPEERARFCRAYLGVAEGVPDEEVSRGEVEALVAESDAYSLATHLLWTMWGLLQSKSGDEVPGFDFIKYAKEKLRMYHHFSELFLPVP